ncbi:MAG: ZIP family metal transporter [Cyclobacteriaceae bacterium]
MILIFITLFFFTFLSGLSVKYLGITSSNIKNPLIFAGSFLFSITIIHILPEVFTLAEEPLVIGLWILGGFFFQQFLEHLTAGVEHGHFHSHGEVSSSFKASLLIGLTIHSLLEGALLTHDSPFHEKHESYSLLLGIILHKMPAAFALMATVVGGGKFKTSSWVILVLFSLASPFGLLLSDQILTFSDQTLLYLFGFVSGSFLHISTTIFVESSPEHRFAWKKILISLFGALMAIAVEFGL